MGLANDKVTICHVPLGNPDNAHTIIISESALRPHLLPNGDLHGGDYFGECLPKAYQGFYPCNLGLKNEFVSNNPTLTRHDYATFDYKLRNQTDLIVDSVIEAKKDQFNSPWSMSSSFNYKLESVEFNLSSENMGNRHFIDFCLDGRSIHKGRVDFTINEVTVVMDNPGEFNTSAELFCDLSRNNDTTPYLSGINFAGFPLTFKFMPKYCVLRIHAEEYISDIPRNYIRNHNKLTAIINSNIDGLRQSRNP